MSNADHLTEKSHTTSGLPDLDSSSDKVAHLEDEAATDSVPLKNEGAINAVSAACNIHDQNDDEGTTSFSMGGHVCGVCVSNDIVYLVKLIDEALYMYSVGGDFTKKHMLNGVKCTRDLVLVRLIDKDKLVITAGDPHSLYHLPIRDVGGKHFIGNAHLQKLDYPPRGLCLNHKNNLVVTDERNRILHVYNSSGNEINTIKLPPGITPQYLTSDPSGGYIVTGDNQIIWIDGEGAQQRRLKDTACEIAMSNLRGVVRDSENRYLVADCGKNQLLLFSKDGRDVKCLVKDEISQPFCLYLDQQQDKLYVGTCDGRVMVYEYYMLLGKQRPLRYSQPRLGIGKLEKSVLPESESSDMREGDVYDQASYLLSLEEAVEKRWRTEIPGVVWMDESDQGEKKINMSDADHLTLTETSDTSVLPYLEKGTGSDGVPRQEGGTVSVTDAIYKKPDQQPSESAEISRFIVDDYLYGVCPYNNIIFVFKCDSILYMYSTSCDLIKQRVVNGMNSFDMIVMVQDDGDKLILTSHNPHCLYYIPIQSAGDTCTLGTTCSKQLNYAPYGLCLNYNNNLVVADKRNNSFHVYNSSLTEITTIKLPPGVNPMHLSSDPSGGYVVTGGNSEQIIWIDGQGAQQRRHKRSACGIALSDVYNIVRDSENRYLVADCTNNQLLLFSNDGGDVRCLVKNSIIRPFSLYLDQHQNKLYVGALSGRLVVYDYNMLLGKDKHDIK